MQIYKEELPDLVELYDKTMKMHNLKGVDKKELDDSANYFLSSGKKFIGDYEQYIKEEIYGSDPGRSIMDLEGYDMLAAGLEGLGQAIFHKYRAGIYEQLTVDSNGTDNKKKLAQGDRTEYAKGASAAIEGAIRTVESLHKNIQERLNNLKNKRSRY